MSRSTWKKPRFQANVPGVHLIRVWTAVDNWQRDSRPGHQGHRHSPGALPIHPILIGVSDGDTDLPRDNLVLLDEEDMGAEDNCDPNPTITFHETEIKGDCDVDGFILQLTCTWTATDACGNSSSFHIVVGSPMKSLLSCLIFLPM
ncbi:MAG: hypothetical protein R2787_04450 [Saprospiraceae bacterium]